MKLHIPFLLTIILFFSNNANSQNNYIGLFGNYYFETGKYSSDKMIRVNKSISIVYNREYCTFFIEGLGTKSFPIRGYNTEIVGKYLRTTFVNQETNTIPDGHYSIFIDEGDGELDFGISLPSLPNDKVYPNGFTYLVDKVQKISENGLVKDRIRINNFDSLVLQTKKFDSLQNISTQLETQRKKEELDDDSLFLVEKEKSKLESEQKLLSEGNNYNPTNIKWINDTLVKWINLEENEVFYSDFKVSINEKGKITQITPDGKGYVIEKYLPIISELIVGKEVKPFQSKSTGQFYSSYSTVHIGLYHDPQKKKKKKSFNDLLNRN